MTAPPAPSACTLVLGLGRFGGGVGAARFLHRRGAAVRIADRAPAADLEDSQRLLADLDGVDWQLGREDLGLLEGVDRVVVNPGVPDGNPVLQAARERGLAVTQEVDLFLLHYPGKVVAVTGTNGKSSTATLLHAALQRAGFDALLGGNIGHSLLDDEARWRPDQIAVLEVSSFQLERLGDRPRVLGAVLTRVLRDHVDRHGSLAAYHAAKARLPQVATGFCVHAADDPVAAAFPTPARRVLFATEPPQPDSCGIADGWLVARLGEGPAARLLHTSAMRLLGEFQRENALAAGAAALLLGAAPQPVGLALASAAPLPFRLQLIAVHDGVRIYDNGVSTEIESTRSALGAIDGPIRWVAGGKSKDGDYRAVAAATGGRIASAHLFGAAAAPLARELPTALPTALPVTVDDRLTAALDHALAACRPGDALLFSPAFASFDQYPNFRARALEFHRWLAALRQPRADAATAAR
ncbi:MAG: UDP-N-acetylmuramoyl-L-alanine--D-glutamate ligase [Planctomycetota bacterium]